MLTVKRGEPAADRSRGFNFHEVVGSHFCKQRKGGMLPDEKNLSADCYIFMYAFIFFGILYFGREFKLFVVVLLFLLR